MANSDCFKRFFKGASLEAEDLYLLEAFQIAYLPGWAPERELAAVLWDQPALGRYLIKRCPSIKEYVDRVLAQFGPAANPAELASLGDKLVWTIADLLVYNKSPEIYDNMDFHNWDFGEVTRITPLQDKIVVDAGAGAGRVALEAAQTAAVVFAVEPVGRNRQFIREKAQKAQLDNLFVMDGFQNAIPLPAAWVDVLITSHALGWDLEAELVEFERVVKPGGFIIHCPGTADNTREEPQHQRLISADWNYSFARYQQSDGWKRKYWKQL